jgi:hypothetical protein
MLIENLKALGRNFSQDKKANKFKKIGSIIAVILLILCACAIFGTWTDIWHEFGENLYHIFND